ETAFVEGIGEHMQAVPLAAGCFVVVYPGVTVSTGAIFGDEGLTRDAENVRMRDFIEDTAGSIQSAMCFGRNDLQAVACKRFPEVKRAIEWLSRFAPSRMSGSGSAVFAAVTNPAEGQRIVRQCPGGWQAWCVAGLAQHPMWQRLAVSNR
ncbi:MAG: 4-(cytidine 5'-diphospho)-2-C-methyl-D-erythritol kinase, partial [Rhodocyclaceae bacterium]|nr:4-(cytidine 5'-diphospho)-2-C-methyl-D-erythritol kinase [Rhodocyclaceae bacterium]